METAGNTVSEIDPTQRGAVSAIAVVPLSGRLFGRENEAAVAR